MKENFIFVILSCRTNFLTLRRRFIFLSTGGSGLSSRKTVAIYHGDDKCLLFHFKLDDFVPAVRKILMEKLKARLLTKVIFEFIYSIGTYPFHAIRTAF